ncbi:MAG: GYD domain-containing protein [Dehalococcoidia bacterium]|nr:GYD domain-containing protein [Dehalococcoidia bacterium]
MAKFVMLTTLTDEGRKTLMDKPERLQEVNKEVESMGAKVLAQYALLGPYDFISVLEAPSNEDVSRIAFSLGARGTLQPVTLAAIEVDELIRKLKS